MAVLRQAWQFQLDDARRAFHGYRSLERILHRSAAEHAARVRFQPSCRDLLVLARFAPDDDETWDSILDPRNNDFGFEQAAAGRITSILAESCESLGAASDVAPQFIEAVLTHIGWADGDVHQILYGQRISTLFRQERLVEDEVVSACETWLPGGWASPATAREWGRRLDVEEAALEQATAEVAETLAERVGRPSRWLRDRIGQGLSDLQSSYSRAKGVVWILVD